MDDLPFILASEMVSMNTIGAEKRAIDVGHHDHTGTQQTRRSVQLTLAATTTATTTKPQLTRGSVQSMATATTATAAIATQVAGRNVQLTLPEFQAVL